MEESDSPQEDSKNSSEETDKNDEFTRSVRSYECVFCKRGFTTAQALGGHMNIHRKHRAPKTNPNHCPSDDLHHRVLLADGHEGYESFRPFLANIQGYPQWHFGHDHDNQVRVNNKSCDNINSPTDTYSTTSTSTVTTRPSDLLRESWSDTSLNLGIVTTRNEEDKEEIIIGDMEVDLELRLGYDH